MSKVGSLSTHYKNDIKNPRSKCDAPELNGTQDQASTETIMLNTNDNDEFVVAIKMSALIP